jgi:hypothetical protein
MGTTYYVSASGGNNNNAGDQPDRPLRTIQAAINKVQAGDTITVRAGTYAERLHIQKPGTAEAPILITAHEGEQPVIDGAALDIPADAALVVIQQSQDVTLRGLIVRGAGGRGVVVDRSGRITIRQCAIESCYGGGLHARQCDTLLIEKCDIHDCARRFMAHGPARDNVALLVRYCTNVTLQENRVYENSDHGVGIGPGCRAVIARQNICYDNRASQIGITSSVEVVIESNLCYHTGNVNFLNLNGQRAPGIIKDDLRQYESRGLWHTRAVRIINNIIVGCGVGFQTRRSGGLLSDVQVAHNTIVNSTEQAIKLTLLEASRRSYVENNLIASSQEGAMALVPRGDGIVWRHNLWTSFPGSAVYNPSSDVVGAEVGLTNMNAPVAAGAVTADPYKLINGSIAIDRGIRHNGAATTDYWGTPRGGIPDIGASEFPNGSGDEPTGDPTLPPAGTRVAAGLLCLYDFKQGQGQQISDVGRAGEPLHLRLMNEANASWTSHGLEITRPVLISSERPATKIIGACRQSGEITLEAWVRPANVSQDGPARIISLSDSKTQRNFMLGQGLHGNQPTDLFVARLRTSQTSTNGLPAVISPIGSAAPALTHLVYTRRGDGQARLYVNGQERGVLQVGGDFSNWDERMPLLLADELSEDRPWLGLYHLVAIYERALAPAEVLHNYEAGTGGDTSLAAEFAIPAGDAYGVAPHVVEFDAADTIATAGVSGYFWEFGDGQTSNRAAPVYTYTSPGIYTVSLTVTDANGQTDKLTKERYITVVERPVAPLPPEFARFILINVQSSQVMAFGLQYPNLRCHVMWNEDPYHTLTFAEIDDVRRNYTDGNDIELVWVDELEEV